MERYITRDEPNKQRIAVINTQTGQVMGYEYYSRSKGQRAWASEGVRMDLAMEAARNRINRLNRGDVAEAEILPEGVTKLDSGNYQSTKTGKNYSTLDELNTAETEFDRITGLEEDVSKFEERITTAGRLREELAENVGARQQGQLLSQLRRSILATGGEQGQVEALVPQIQEGSQRSLQDYITGSQATTQEQLAQFIPTEIGAEYNQAQLADAMRQFLMSEETERAQIQASLTGQPEWWEGIIGSAGTAAGTAAITKGIPYLASLAAAASDIRVKENISQVGTLDNGLPVYLFNYKGSHTPQIGLMAQDVEQVNDDAVVEINGIKHVYYAQAVK